MPQNLIVVEKVESRLKEVQRLLEPLRPKGAGGRYLVPAQLVARTDTREIVLAVKEKELGKSYRDWFFRTSNEKVMGQYFEEWSQSSNREWRLAQSCLHFYFVVNPVSQPIEVVAVHCEPKEIGNDPKALIKRGPHIHVRGAGSPLSHSHFPLNYCHLTEIMASIDSLHHALQRAVDIMAREVLLLDW